MNSLVIYNCSSSLCSRLQLSSLQLAVIGVAFIVLLVAIYLIVSFEKLKTQDPQPRLSTAPDYETEVLRSQYRLEEYQAFLNWQLQMGIIDFNEYDDLFAKGLPFLR